MQSTLLRVSGIFRTGLEAVDANIINLPLPAAQALLGVKDGQVTEVALLLRQEGESPMVAKALREQLAGEPVEVLTWRESIPMLAQILRAGPRIQLHHEWRGAGDGRVGHPQYDSHEGAGTPL